MKKRCLQILLVLSVMAFSAAIAAAHCEIPCGIYDDDARFKMVAEHITTIEKSMKQILELQGEKPVHYNQLVRWVMNKETHANELQHIVTQYFMTQRIKLDTKDIETATKVSMISRQFGATYAESLPAIPYKEFLGLVNDL